MYATPTPAQINAAQMVFIAEAFYIMVKSEFDKWKQDIINNDQFHIGDEYYSDECKAGNHDLPADKILRDPEDCMYISGFSFTGAQPGTDADRFYTRLRKLAINNGFKYGETADQTARTDWYSRKCSLIDITQSIHCLQREDLNETTFDQLINILAGMFAPLVDNEALEPLRVQYYNERMQEQAQKKIVFEDTEASFKWFQCLKKYIPIADFLPTLFPNPDEDDEQRVEGIEYILSYNPDCYIFQMKAGDSWMYENHKSTNCQYAFINLHEELIESDDLETVERALFKHFLQHLNR